MASKENEIKTLTLGIALIALVITIAAFYRTGGTRSLRQQVERIGARTEDAAKFTRETTADAFERMEKLLRGKQESPSETEKVSSGAGNASPETEKDPPKIGSA